MDTRTIPVQGSIGLKRVTKEQFVSRWVAHAREFYDLTLGLQPVDVRQVEAIERDVSELAAKRFEYLFGMFGNGSF